MTLNLKYNKNYFYLNKQKMYSANKFNYNHIPQELRL